MLTEKGEWDKTGRIPGESGLSVGAGGDRAELRPLDNFGFRSVSVLKIDVEGLRTRFWPRRKGSFAEAGR